MAFQFSLATVLRVRLLHEEREERLLQKIFHETAHVRQSIAKLDDKLLHVARSRTAQVADVIPARDLHLSATATTELYECRKQLEAQLEKLEQLKDAQIQIYQVARRDREAVHDLRSKRLVIHNASLIARERKSSDDIFSARRYRSLNL